MTIHIKRVDLRQQSIRTRMPFRYGIATLTAAPYLMVFAEFEIDGRTVRGVAADILPPKWFTKQPDATLEAEQAEMLAVIRRAADLSLEVGPQPSAYRWWRTLYQLQMVDPNLQCHPSLLKGFGVSLLERAAIDATCRRAGTTFAEALKCNLFQIQLAEHHEELTGEPTTYLPQSPHESMAVRHTVGLSDPLTAAEIAPEDQVDDGLPLALDECIQRYGLHYFKIKMPADLSAARQRLSAIATIFESHCAGTPLFTLDGNEFFDDPAAFRTYWSELCGDIGASRLVSSDGLLLVEQPLHREVALAGQVREVFADWTDRPPIIIDESDATVDSFSQALDLGYDGTSHKNCKGVFKGIANVCLVNARKQVSRDRRHIITGEDLMNIGPVALLQDLAVCASLGMNHVERNGHHYVAGLQQFPESVQTSVLEKHGDLYTSDTTVESQSWPRVAIRDGQISLQSINAAPFGYAIDIQPDDFEPVSEN